MLEKSFYESQADEMYYFNFHYATNNIMPAHFHSNTEMLFVNKGRVKVIINGKEAILKKNDIAISNAFDVHYYLGDVDSEVYVLVYGNIYHSKSPMEKNNKVFDNFLYHNEGTKEIFELLQMFYGQKSDDNFELKLGFINYLYGLLLKHYPNQVIDKDKADKEFSTILLYVSKNSNKNIKLDDVAKKFGYSKNHFSMIFNKITGMHFRDYLNRIRLEKMEEIMKNDSNLSICTAALNCGFNSLNTYYRAKNKFL